MAGRGLGASVYWDTPKPSGIGSGLCWVVARGLALAAPVVYLLWPNDLTWWFAPLLAVPLAGLVMWRHERKSSPDEGFGGGDVATLTPPPDHGCGSWRPRV